MPTQEERITFLEYTTREYKPIFKDISHEMTIVKGLIVDQTIITQELRRDMDDVKGRLTRVEDQMTRLEDRMTRVEDRMMRVEDRLIRLEDRMTHIEEKLDTILTLLKPS